MEKNNGQPQTAAVDLFTAADRFVSASRLYGRLHRWWLLLRRYWWVIVLIMLVSLVPVYLLTASSAPGYESKARMWLTGKLDIYEGRLYTEELINFLGTQAELLRSPAIQGRALDRLRAEFKSDPAALAGGGGTQSKLLDKPTALLKKLLTVGVGASSN